MRALGVAGNKALSPHGCPSLSCSLLPGAWPNSGSCRHLERGPKLWDLSVSVSSTFLNKLYREKYIRDDSYGLNSGHESLSALQKLPLTLPFCKPSYSFLSNFSQIISFAESKQILCILQYRFRSLKSKPQVHRITHTHIHSLIQLTFPRDLLTIWFLFQDSGTS